MTGSKFVTTGTIFGMTGTTEWIFAMTGMISAAIKGMCDMTGMTSGATANAFKKNTPEKGVFFYMAGRLFL
jgi:hypothetical protein